MLPISLKDVGVLIMAVSMLGIIVSLMFLLVNKKARAWAFIVFCAAFILGYLVLFLQNPKLIEFVGF